MRKQIPIPPGDSMRYMILSLIAVCGELPVDQLPRLTGGERYKDNVIKDLKAYKWLHTYYADQYRAFRISRNGKMMLLEKNPDRFADQQFLTTLNKDLMQRNFNIVVRKGEEIIFISDHIKNLIPELQEESGSKDDSDSKLLGESQMFMKQQTFQFTDGTEGDLFLITDMSIHPSPLPEQSPNSRLRYATRCLTYGSPRQRER